MVFIPGKLNSFHRNYKRTAFCQTPVQILPATSKKKKTKYEMRLFTKTVTLKRDSKKWHAKIKFKTFGLSASEVEQALEAVARAQVLVEAWQMV